MLDTEAPTDSGLPIDLGLPAVPEMGDYATGHAHLRDGEYALAIATLESQLGRLEELPMDELSTFFGDLGLAYYYHGRNLSSAGRVDASQYAYQRAAVYFGEAAHTATHGVFATVAEYYRALALISAHDYEGARAAGEAFLTNHPEAAIAAELLPATSVPLIREILTVAYFQVAESAGARQQAVLIESGLEHAEEAIAGLPDGVIQPYFFTGRHAHQRGDMAQARERLTQFIQAMERIPRARWSPDDVTTVAEARLLLESTE